MVLFPLKEERCLPGKGYARARPGYRFGDNVVGAWGDGADGTAAVSAKASTPLSSGNALPGDFIGPSLALVPLTAREQIPGAGIFPMRLRKSGSAQSRLIMQAFTFGAAIGYLLQ
jgi:hypothetical protein